MTNTFRFIGLLLILLAIACKPQNANYQQDAANPAILHKAIREITESLVFEIFTPPVASRVYAYSTIAAYEAMVPGEPNYVSLAGQVNGLKPVPQPEAGKAYCFPIASLKALIDVGKKWTFSDEEWVAYEKEVVTQYQGQIGVPKDVLERSLQYGAKVAAHIIDWSMKDNYPQTRTMPKYSIQKDPASWQPTPPAYADGIEPHWNKIRPFALTAANECHPIPPPPYSTDKKSEFYKMAKEVHDSVRLNSTYFQETANYWDDNPFALQVTGHVMTSIKKISPGGHWINIGTQIAKKEKSSWMKSIETYALTSMALMDGFISCWDTKYTYNLVRPETYITTHIDKEWTPFIQTPPFPEYTSGHSVISAASATILTYEFGENHAFTDSTEVIFGMKERTFPSFHQAALQASVSRLYGGIHYRIALDRGNEQGKKVGQVVLKRLRTRKEAYGAK